MFNQNTCITNNTYQHIIQLVKGGRMGVRRFFTDPSEFTEFKKGARTRRRGRRRRRLLQDFHGFLVLRWVGLCSAQPRWRYPTLESGMDILKRLVDVCVFWRAGGLFQSLTRAQICPKVYGLIHTSSSALSSGQISPPRSWGGLLCEFRTKKPQPHWEMCLCYGMPVQFKRKTGSPVPRDSAAGAPRELPLPWAGVDVDLLPLEVFFYDVAVSLLFNALWQHVKNLWMVTHQR